MVKECVVRILLIGGPLDGQWQEVTREPEALHCEHAGACCTYQRVLWAWPARDALWLFWWYGQPAPDAVLATLARAGLEPVCSQREALGEGGLAVRASGAHSAERRV